MKIVMRSIPIILSAILLAVILANYQFVKKCSQANKTFAKNETTTRWQLNRNEKEINALKQWVIALSFENPSDAVSSDTLKTLRQMARQDDSLHLALEIQSGIIQDHEYRDLVSSSEKMIFSMTGSNRERIIRKMEQEILPTVSDDKRRHLLEDFARTGIASSQTKIEEVFPGNEGVKLEVLVGMVRSLRVNHDFKTMDRLVEEYMALPKDSPVRQYVLYEHVRMVKEENAQAALVVANEYLRNEDISLPEFKKKISLLLEEK